MQRDVGKTLRHALDNGIEGPRTEHKMSWYVCAAIEHIMMLMLALSTCPVTDRGFCPRHAHFRVAAKARLAGSTRPVPVTATQLVVLRHYRPASRRSTMQNKKRKTPMRITRTLSMEPT